jgi:glycosyltransferase involved in cell wall biosynthesis
MKTPLSTSVPFAVLVPAYNNQGTIRPLLQKLLLYGYPILVVDDGSLDKTLNIVKSFGHGVGVHSHINNQGKGAALRAGFDLLREQGFSYALTIDADEQHFPSDIPKFIEAAARFPDALLIGTRNMKEAGAPLYRRIGMYLSNLIIKSTTNVSIQDSQCGFRWYPLNQIENLNLVGRQFDFELEILIKAARADIQIHQIPVQSTYHVSGGLVSHFRPLQDTLQILSSLSYMFLQTLRQKFIHWLKTVDGSYLNPSKRLTESKLNLYHPD